MTDTVEQPMRRVFKVALVEKTAALEGGEDQGWHRYVLENGISTIVGQRRGKLKDVTAYVTEYVQQLNERHLMGRSTANPRGKKLAHAAKNKTPSK
jgi:hypothetical protein